MDAYCMYCGCRVRALGVKVTETKSLRKTEEK